MKAMLAWSLISGPELYDLFYSDRRKVVQFEVWMKFSRSCETSSRLKADIILCSRSRLQQTGSAPSVWHQTVAEKMSAPPPDMFVQCCEFQFFFVFLIYGGLEIKHHREAVCRSVRLCFRNHHQHQQLFKPHSYVSASVINDQDPGDARVPEREDNQCNQWILSAWPAGQSVNLLSAHLTE